MGDGVERALDPRSIPYARLGNWITTGVVTSSLLFALALVLLLVDLPGWSKAALGLAWTAIALAMVWWSHRWPVLTHRYAGYKVDPLGVEIRTGVRWRSVTNVPRSRIQHTDVSQGPLERRFGLGTLSIYTAGTEHARVALHGLDHGTALRIRDFLLQGDGGDAV